MAATKKLRRQALAGACSVFGYGDFKPGDVHEFPADVANTLGFGWEDAPEEAETAPGGDAAPAEPAPKRKRVRVRELTPTTPSPADVSDAAEPPPEA